MTENEELCYSRINVLTAFMATATTEPYRRRTIEHIKKSLPIIQERIAAYQRQPQEPFCDAAARMLVEWIKEDGEDWATVSWTINGAGAYFLDHPAELEKELRK